MAESVKSKAEQLLLNDLTAESMPPVVGHSLASRFSSAKALPLPTHKRFRNLTGQLFGMLQVMEFVGMDVKSGAVWRCLCECGKEHYVKANVLITGQSRSCGCSHVVHGMHGTKLYGKWSGMLARCYKPGTRSFELYGGRGISVCEEWRGSFAKFAEWALGNGYEENKQIDRYPNVDGNYEPSNCRFVSASENQRNKRDNQMVSAYGETKTLVEWTEDDRCNVNYQTLWKRLFRHGWDAERAITQEARGYDQSKAKR